MEAVATNGKSPAPTKVQGDFQNAIDSNANKNLLKGKALSTLVAKLALAGHAVHKGQSDDFTVCKYGMTRYCKDVEELQDFADQLGVKL